MSATVGHLLKQAREQRSLSLADAAQATRIRQHYLRALETDDMNALPSVTQGRGFLRAYAGYLGLDGDALLARLDNRPEPAKTPAAPDKARPSAPDEPTRQTAEGNPPTMPSAPAATAYPATAFPSAALSPQTVAPGVDSPEASAIFENLGGKLQRQREQLGLSLEDVERHTHLRERYLLALEAGSLEDLPSPVQGRGMLNNYAAFLGMNPEPLLLLFAEGLQARLAARQAVQQPERAAAKRRKRRGLPRALRRIFSADILIGGALTVFLGLIVFWVAVRIYATTTSQTPEPTAPSIAQVLLATASPTPPPTEQPPTPTPPPTQAFPTLPPATDPASGAVVTANPEGGVQVYISVRERGWMRVMVDGTVEFEGRVIPGAAYPFAGGSSVEVLVSSGSAFQVTLNGFDQGLIGAYGEVVSRIYTVQGLVTPTPTITPTPAPTQPATATPPATQTGVPALP